MRRSMTIPLALASAGLMVAVTSVASAAQPSSAGGVVPKVKRSDISPRIMTPIGSDLSVRLSGANRYATAAAVSEYYWSPEFTVSVFLASGENHPDALALGASASGAGPVLLSTKSEMPAETVRELDRLNPAQPCHPSAEH